MENKLKKDDRIKILFETMAAQTQGLPAQMLFDYLGFVMGIRSDLKQECYESVRRLFQE
jgi:hypothetical protein